MPQTKQQNTVENQAVNWRLELLHVTQTQVLFNGQVLGTLDGRSALLFAYLALEGSTPRSKMAGLLYPNNTDDTARANLRQRLKRLRDTFGTDLIVPEDTLRLRPDLEVDAVQLESLAFTGEYEKAILFGGKLLPHLEPDDSPELSEWLDATRERLNLAWREALENESERLEKTNLAQALELALRLLENDALSEEAHRRVMRLYYLQGDRSSALKAFERLKTTLTNEMGIEPLAQTLELLRVIERGETTPQHAPKATPVTLQRPPVLIGREHEWAQLENAWAKGQMIVISGEAGAGKTRLALDFLASKGEFARFDGRPGDALVSYSTHARTYRQMLQNDQINLPEWVRLELSRILPELGTPPSPIQNEADKLRFYQAKIETTRLAVKAGMQNVLLDDLQFMDDASFEAGFGIYLQNTQNASMHTILTCRETELSELQLQTLKQAFDAGQAIQIKLSPLEQFEVQAMLESLGVSGLERFGQTMHQATGGNPMFVLETARDLVSGGNLEQAQTEALPLPKSVSAAIRNRLTKLEPAAIRLARVASVAATDFTLELAANVLETHVLDLSDSVEQLEKAQVLQGLTFTHDLIAQTTLEGLPLSIRNLLHDRIAVYLEKIEGNPARIAHHFLEAGMETRAVPFLTAAGELVFNNYQFGVAANLFEQAAKIHEQFGNTDAAFDQYYRARDCLLNTDFNEQHERIVKHLQNLANTPRKQAKVWFAESERIMNTGRGEEMELMARTGLAIAESINDLELQLNLSEALGNALWIQGRIEETLEVFERTVQLAEQRQIPTELGVSLCNLGVALDHLDRHREAIVVHTRALETLRSVDAKTHLISVTSNLSVSHAELGEMQTSLNWARESIEIDSSIGSNSVEKQIPALLSLGTVLVDLCKFQEAFEIYQNAIDLGLQYADPRMNYVQMRMAALLLILGDANAAQNLLRQCLDTEYFLFAQLRLTCLRLQIEAFGLTGQSPENLLLQGRDLLEQTTRPMVRGKWFIQACLYESPEKQLEQMLEVIQISKAKDLNGMRIAAETRCAQILLVLQRPEEVLGHTQKVQELLKNYNQDEFYLGEVVLTHCRALEANKHKDTIPFLEKTLHWLLETANNHVPPEYRESFLTKNPHNASILELAREAGLETTSFK
jgi:DNA-binding SARP family transcriptional activator